MMCSSYIDGLSKIYAIAQEHVHSSLNLKHIKFSLGGGYKPIK